MTVLLRSPECLEFSLRPRWRSLLFLAFLGIVGLCLAYQAVRVAIVTTLEPSPSISQLQKALAIDPDNPALLHQLGLLYSYFERELSPAEGIRNLRRAAELSPHRTAYWVDWAAACTGIGDLACADRAYVRARTLSPRSPRVLWSVANHDLLVGRAEEAWPLFQRLLEMSPEYASYTFRVCLRAVAEPRLIYQKVLPAGNDPGLKLAYIDFLSEQGRFEDAFRVWTLTATNAPPFPFSSIAMYLQRLLDQGRFKEARSVWTGLQRLGVVAKPSQPGADNLVYNGGFEQAPLNAGFDWRVQSIRYTAVDSADAAAYQGARCLRVDFTLSRNDESEPVYQIMAVLPNQRYRLTADVRSDSITSDSGPRLRVVDLSCPECPSAASETAIGTTPWHAVSFEFLTGPRTEVVRLGVWRPRSRTFPTEISGSFWVDEVRVQPLGPAGEPAASGGAR